jgi:hypothetical protein
MTISRKTNFRHLQNKSNLKRVFKSKNKYCYKKKKNIFRKKFNLNNFLIFLKYLKKKKKKHFY